jgi:hypothetical protein
LKDSDPLSDKESWAVKRAEPLRPEIEYKSIDPVEMKQIWNQAFAYMCNRVNLTEDFKFLVGDIYCDTVVGKAYSCVNPLAVDFEKLDPSTEEGRALLGFPNAWKEIDSKDLANKVFIEKDS